MSPTPDIRLRLLHLLRPPHGRYMPDPTEAATVAIDALEDALGRMAGDWKTDDLGSFWQAATEACVLRLIRLKPEMVKHVNESSGDGTP